MSNLSKQMHAQGFIDVKPIPAERMVPLANRHGGKNPLPVLETSAGVYVSAWAIHHKLIARMLKSKQPCTLQLVVDTNVPGHPSVSMMVVPVDLMKGK